MKGDNELEARAAACIRENKRVRMADIAIDSDGKILKDRYDPGRVKVIEEPSADILVTKEGRLFVSREYMGPEPGTCFKIPQVEVIAVPQYDEVDIVIGGFHSTVFTRKGTAKAICEIATREIKSIPEVIRLALEQVVDQGGTDVIPVPVRRGR